ncbi:hypothetical protein PHLCEN_2v4425 [Hermanssonia centrifuga]|uniref:Protein-S-isoprenylcysteine O-methyltransferase n=1 Tax=Hermanssonia centrifuga TaxID=98765 RepID=A0A2R6PNK1_9APHY|nr:hypothetical protein PHLCEN_2v4425 [Hermanssonia centrifuga]
MTANMSAAKSCSSTHSLVWLSTAYELAYIAIDSDPYSKLSQLIVTWLPEDSTDVHLDYFPPPFTTSACIRLVLLASLTQLSARLALKNFASFPLIPCTAASSRVLYVPPSQIPTPLTHDPSKPSPAPVPKKDKGRILFTLRPSHELVNRGPYHYARHPMYTSVSLAFLGSGLLHLSSGSFTRSLVKSSRLSLPVFSRNWAELLPQTFAGILPVSVVDALSNSWMYARWDVGRWTGVLAIALSFVALGTFFGLVRMANSAGGAIQQAVDFASMGPRIPFYSRPFLAFRGCPSMMPQYI